MAPIILQDFFTKKLNEIIESYNDINKDLLNIIFYGNSGGMMDYIYKKSCFIKKIENLSPILLNSNPDLDKLLNQLCKEENNVRSKEPCCKCRKD